MAQQRDVTGEVILAVQQIEEIEATLPENKRNEMRTDVGMAKTSYRLNRDHAIYTYQNDCNERNYKAALHNYGCAYVDTLKQIIATYATK